MLRVMAHVSQVATATTFLLVSACVSSTVGEVQKDDKYDPERVAETHVKLGIGYLQQGKPEWALQKLKKALDAAPDYADAHSAIALVYEQLLDPQKADEHYREAIDLKPKDGGVYNNYGVFLCKHNKLIEAEQNFLKAINTPRYLTPELAYENAGSCARRIPDLEKAESYLRRALEKNPKLASALYEMAEINFAKSNLMSTRAYLQRFEEVSSHSARSLWLGIVVERKLGDKLAEASYAKQLQTLFPESTEYRRLMDRSQGVLP